MEIIKKKKDKNGVNVSVISPKRILVDEKHLGKNKNGSCEDECLKFIC